MDIRFFVAAPRSGSTLFMRVMAQHPDLAVTSRNILMGNMKPRDAFNQHREFTPDYSILSDENHPVVVQAQTLGKKAVVSKEEYGNDQNTGTPELNECNYEMFPDDEAIRKTRPVFTFRNPIHEFDSWLKRGWNDLDSFFLSYETLYKTFQRAQKVIPDTVFYTYEYMVKTPQTQATVFRAVCDHWDIDFHSSMLQFEDEFGAKFIYRDANEAEIYKNRNPKEIFTTVMNSKGIEADVKSHGLVTDEQKAQLIERLGEIYRSVHTECMKRFDSKPDNMVMKAQMK